MEEQERSWFVVTKDYLYDNDAFLYLGGLLLVVVGFMIWALHKEGVRNVQLQQDVTELRLLIAQKNTEIFNLQLDLNKKKDLEKITPVSPQTVIEVSANKLNQKINKVQDALMPKPTDPRVVVKTETKIKTIESQSRLDKELQNNMLESFCNAQPTNPKCKGKH